MKPGRLADFALIGLVPLFFATNIVMGRAVVAEVGPWTLAFLRWSIAFLIVLPFALPALRSGGAALARHAGVIVVLGFLGMWICGGGVYVAVTHTTASNATLIYASANVMILLLEWAFRGRRIGWRELIGTALAFAGVTVVALGGNGFSLNPGDALIAGASLSWAIYSVVLKRPELTALPELPLFAAIMLCGALLLAPMMLWENAGANAFPATWKEWLAVLGIAFLPSVGAFFGYQRGIRRFGPTTMAMTSYLWTPYGLGLAILFLGERLHAYHLVGLALTLPGVVLATARLPQRTPA